MDNIISEVTMKYFLAIVLLSTSVMAEDFYIDLDQKGSDKVLAPHSQLLTQAEYNSMMRYASNAIKEHYCGKHKSVYSEVKLVDTAHKFCLQYKSMNTKDLVGQQKLVKAYLDFRCDEKLKGIEVTEEQKKAFLANCTSLPQIIFKDEVSKYQASEKSEFDLDLSLGIYDVNVASRAPASQDDEFSNKTLESIFSQE